MVTRREFIQASSAMWRTIRGKQSARPSVASSKAEFDGSQQQTVN